VRARVVGRERTLAPGEFVLGVEGLERFVRGEPLRRVHEDATKVLLVGATNAVAVLGFAVAGRVDSGQWTVDSGQWTVWTPSPLVLIFTHIFSVSFSFVNLAWLRELANFSRMSWCREL
jgi:hypothetical protein